MSWKLLIDTLQAIWHTAFPTLMHAVWGDLVDSGNQPAKDPCYEAMYARDTPTTRAWLLEKPSLLAEWFECRFCADRVPRDLRPDPAIALLRALSELVQGLPYDDLLPARRGEVPALPDWGGTATRWLTTAKLADHPYLAPAPAARTRVPARPAPAPERIEDAVAAALGAVRRAVPDVLVLDQTRPDVPLAVVRVIAPGMRHFWRRLAPGRLYTVPVATGDLPHPHAEADLNPATMFA